MRIQRYPEMMTRVYRDAYRKNVQAAIQATIGLGRDSSAQSEILSRTGLEFAI
jgi:hypothetical protein